MTTRHLIAGALLRRELRVALDMGGIKYREHKGLLDSDFVITTTPAVFAVLDRWLQRVNAA
jgi:hypothetical protein